MVSKQYGAYSALALAVALTASASAASAQTVDSSRAGFAGTAGVSSRTINSNTITGRLNADNYRSYISFAVPASATPYASAVVRVNVEGLAGSPNDLTLWDVTSDISTASASDLYVDFGSGTVFGSISGLSTPNAIVDVTLNAAGLAAVNAARGGSVSIGFDETSVGPAPDYVFGGSFGGTQRQLLLTAAPPTPVPTMTEWAMILFGTVLAGGAALYIQRRRQLV